MDFISPIVTSIVGSLMVPVKKNLGFFFYSTKHVANMRKKLSKLNEAKHDMEDKKKDALINDRLIPDSLHHWLDEVEKIIGKTENIPKHGNGCLNLKIRYEAGRSSFKILEEIDKIIVERNGIVIKKQRPLGMVRTSTGPSTSQSDYDVIPNIFRSRLLKFNNVLKSLEQDNNTQMMALWGMGGVGKTTMMKDIKKVVEKRKMFAYVLKVDIGTKYDPISTQKHIANHMGVTLNEQTKEDRVERLEKIFEQMSKMGKKILFILDDVWDVIDLKDIGLEIPFPKGFKLLVTSRKRHVCISMGIETVFEVGPLEQEEAKQFFFDSVNISNEDEELYIIGEDIVNKCRGLPIAIKTIALTLRGREKVAWEAALDDMQRHNLKDIESLEHIVNNIFDISYNNLKMEEEKAIFVLCGLFPDDSDIALEELLMYGWGLQYLKKTNNLVKARKLTHLYVDNLINANLLIESYTSGCVKMHDLARDFVLSNISRFKQASIVNHGDKWPTLESCERILITCKGMSEFPKDFYYPNLVLLKLMNVYELLKLPDDFHKQMEKLEVMAYENIQYPLHAQSLCYSMSLRTLCLHSCSLVDNDISFLGTLVTLEVLSLAHCGINRLPSTIKKLKMLKLLNLNGCLELCIDDGVFQSLDKLEELYMRVSKRKSIRFSDANCDELRQMLGKLYALEVEFIENIVLPKNVSFKNLQRFRISMGCFFEHGLYSYSGDKHSFNNTLELVTNSNDLTECKINELFSRTEELYLSVKDMSSVGDILMSPSQHSTFFHLKFLNVFGCEKLTHLFTIQMANAMKKLESLKVSSCPLLKSIVSSCDSVNVMVLPELVNLELNYLPNFTSIILGKDISATQPPLLNKEVMIPNLSRLKINGLKKLKQIWACDYTSGEEDNTSMLKMIVVNDCNSLVNLFPCNPMQLLTHLEKLQVSKCCSIEVVFNIDLGKIKKHISNLRSIRVSELGELSEVWRINEENYSGHLICGFQAVETIHIRNCKKFKNVFTPTTANFDMSALINIYIEDAKVEDVEISGISKVDEDMSIVAFPSYHITRAFNKIRKIDFKSFEGAKVLFEIETPSVNKELVTTHQQQSLPLLPRLEDLKLEDIHSMSYVWKCNNWSELFILHKHQPQSSFQNLTNITLIKCDGIKYLFSPLMFKFLSSLKKLDIRICEGIEEVVSNRDDDEVSNTSTTTLFPCLDDICILECPSLSTLIPCDAARQMQKLQKFFIRDCKSLVEVFESNQGSVSFPTPKTITNLHHQLTNLKKLDIHECDLLEYIFTFSTLESLKKLEKLVIRRCKAMKVIVREEHGEETSSEVVFPRLKSIQLVDLPKLVGFFMGMNTDFEWQSLDHLKIDKCPQMMVFTSGESIAPKLKHIHTTLGKHNLECGLNFPQTPPSSGDNVRPAAQGATWSFHNLIEINLNWNGELKNIVPSNELQQLQILEKVIVINDWRVEEVFEVSNNESPTVVTFPRLREVELNCLDSLKYIWKSNEWSILEFPNLTTLSISSCHKLKHVFTPSMVGSLIKLQQLHIERCKELEVIVKKEEEECDGKVGETTFPCLKSLKLEDLKSLKGFWLGKEDLLFPSMNTLVIKKCPEIKVFSDGHAIAYGLKLVETSFGVFQAKDISSFIRNKIQEGFEF